MRYSALVLCSVVAGVSAVACGDQLATAITENSERVQALGGDTGNVANPNIADCASLAGALENLVASLSDAIKRHKAGEPVTQDLDQVLADLQEIAGVAGPCTGQGGSAPGGLDQGQQGQQDQQAQQQQGQQAQQADQDQAQAQAQGQQVHHHHYHH